MRLPFDLLSQNYIKPNLFLCETNKEKICQLDTINLKGSFKFNAYSELNFTISRTYTNMVTGETQVNPFYDKVEALRLVYLEGFGYFEIQDPEITTDGIKEIKDVTAYSLEYRLSQKYLENFKVNTGEEDSLEVIEAAGSSIIPITLVNTVNRNLSLTDLVLEKIYDWTWGHIDDSLLTMSRQFDISRESIYDFIIQDLCDKFNCYAIFDTINNKINLYAESLISKFIGDGTSNTFLISPPYNSIGTVSIDSYKTTKYSYDSETGYLIFTTPPANGARIEVTDGSQEKWQTDVYVSFDNLAQECNVSYSAEDIKTVLTVKGADELDIREVNMGIPYIVDLSYYYTVDWMGQDLYDAYTKYLQNYGSSQDTYTANAEKMLDLQGRISYETHRLSLQYSIADNVTSTTVGTYYVRGGTAPNYYYREVILPDEYNANVEHYYMLSGSDLDEDKFSRLYSAMQTYYVSQDNKDTSEIAKLKTSFAFMETNTIDSLVTALSSANTITSKDVAFSVFFDEMWDQLGLTPLDSLYLKPYTKIKEINEEAGWNEEGNENYWRYYPVTVVIKSIEKDMEDRSSIILDYQTQYNNLQKENIQITLSTSIYNNFTHDQLVRLSPFLREDEYIDDNFIETDSDTIEILMKTKQELLESGRIELARICEPKLSFSMSMANIFALIEFEPIIDQFQLGNFINVVIRKDYVKKARLLAVDVNFNDFSDFTCEFGELLNLKTQTSIHADLLANALMAGNSVASGQSYWNNGADLATSTDLKIQNGLLGAIDGIYNNDKSVLIDNHGILLRQILDNGDYSPYQMWLTNNNVLISTDSFQSAKTGIGVFQVDGHEMYGILAQAVLSGYIESSNIVGGTINIGDGTFTVDQFGNVTMKSSKINGYVDEDHIIAKINVSKEGTTIQGNKISLAGKNINLTSDNITIKSTNFNVAKDGSITATGGTIAGWTISANTFRKETTVDGINYQIYMQSTDGINSSNAFAVRQKGVNETDWTVQFAVNYAGKMTARNAYVSGTINATTLNLGDGVTIPYSKIDNVPDLSVYISKDGTVGSTPSSGSTGFKVSSNGLLTASNAVIYGTIYASNGTIAGYNIGSGGYYSNALYKRVTGDGKEYEVGMKASSGDTDLAFYVKSSSDKWVNNENHFYIKNNGDLYAKNADITGSIKASNGSIGSWNIGDMGNYTEAIYATYCAASTPSTDNPEYAVFMRGKGAATTLAFSVKKRTSSSTSWNDAENPFYVRKDGYVKMERASVAGEITASSGSISGNLTISGSLTHTNGNYTVTLRGVQSSTTSPVFYITDRSSGTAEYPVKINGDGSAKFTNVTITGSSTIAAACIPNLDASKITSGTISTSRLSSGVITTTNFSSKTLTTGNLTVIDGAKIGSWTVTPSGGLTAGSGTGTVGLSSVGVSHGSGWTATWYDIVQAGNSASDKRLKSNITDFDDKYERIFDNLKPVSFEYNIDPDHVRLGFIAQDVKTTFENEGVNNFGGIYTGEGQDQYYRLLKEDFIALNTWQIQKLKEKIKELEDKIEALTMQ